MCWYLISMKIKKYGYPRSLVAPTIALISNHNLYNDQKWVKDITLESPSLVVLTLAD